MNKQDKELLFQDLCARLPYGVKVTIEYSEGKYAHTYDLRAIDNDSTSKFRQRVVVWNYGFYSSVISYPIIDCRPYLRPLSSMTNEEVAKYHELCDTLYGVYFDTIDSIKWLYAHHFDVNGLIPAGLAIAVTQENNPYEN